MFATCTGGSVNIRKGPGTEYEKLGVVRKDDKLLALPAESGWRQVAVKIGDVLAIGYMSDKYIEVMHV